MHSAPTEVPQAHHTNTPRVDDAVSKSARAVFTQQAVKSAHSKVQPRWPIRDPSPPPIMPRPSPGSSLLHPSAQPPWYLANPQ